MQSRAIFKRTGAALSLSLLALMIAMPSLADDQSDAKALWQQLQSANYRQNWKLYDKGKFYRGQEPHGALLTTYLNPEAATGKQAKSGTMPNGAVIVKENYMPNKKLAAITIMQKRQGFDSQHNDWFWAKYGPDGSIQASGKADSCLACHGAVRSNDYIFSFPIAPIKP